MTTCDEEPTVHNGHYEAAVLINAPVKKVWKQYLDIGSWVSSHTIENVYGEPYTQDSITRVSFKRAAELGLLPAYYHYCKIIELIPEQRYVLKTYSEKGGSYGCQMTGFDDARFLALDGKTKLVFNFFMETQSEIVRKDRAAADRAIEVSREGMARNLNELKRLVESQ